MLQRHFNDGGTAQLCHDVEQNLLPLFRQFTGRPESYFRELKDACLLLRLPRPINLLLVDTLVQCVQVGGFLFLVQSRSLFRPTLDRVSSRFPGGRGVGTFQSDGGQRQTGAQGPGRRQVEPGGRAERFTASHSVATPPPILSSFGCPPPRSCSRCNILLLHFPSAFG